MAKRLLFIRHPTAAADVFVGKEGELTVDLDRDELRVHDGVTAGGHAAARKDLANVAAASASNDGKMTQAQVTALVNVINDLAQEILDRVADVDSEETARFNADAAVTSAFQLADSNIIAAYEAADTAHGLLITDNANAIAAEAVTRGNADTALASDISALNTALTDQVVDNALRYGGASAAGTDTYAVNLPISPGAYAAGQCYSFIADVANTGACTINFNGIGASAIKLQDGSAPYTNAIKANQIVYTQYDGTNMVLLNPIPETPATANNLAMIDANGNLLDSLVETDGSGNITANVTGNLAGNVTGNADTATTSTLAAAATALATSRNFSINGDATASAVGFNGTGNVTLTVSLDAGVVDTTELATGAVTGIKLNAMTAGNERVSLHADPVAVIGGGYILNMECRASSNGVVRVSRTHDHANVLSRVYINSVAGPAAKGGVVATYTDDVAVTEGDLIQIYTNSTTSGPFGMSDIWAGVAFGVAVIGDWRRAS